MRQTDSQHGADWEKDLLPSPLKRAGFTDELRKRIEQRAMEAPKRRRPWAAMAGSVCSVTLVIAATLTFQWYNKQQTEQATPLQTRAAIEANEAAQTAASDSFRSGLLIGLRADEKETSYRTLYIAPKEEKPAVVAQGTGILVPYKQSFWKIGSMRYDTPTDRIQFFTTYLADNREPTARTLGDRLFLDDPKTKVIHSERILFAANEYISIEEKEETLLAKGSNVETRVWTTTIPLLSSSRKPVLLNEAVEAMFRSPLYDTNSWTVVRNQGQWMPYVMQPPSLESASAPAMEQVDVPLRQAVINHDETCCSWTDIVRLHPDANDSFTSPEQDMVVISTSDQLLVYGGPDDLDGDPALTVKLKPSESVVMAQWATDHYVEEWAQKTSTLLR